MRGKKGRGDWGREDFSYYHAIGKEGAQRINRAMRTGSLTEKKKNIFFWLQYYYETEKSSFGTRFPPKDIFIYIFFFVFGYSTYCYDAWDLEKINLARPSPK